jgi:hypothetical protein
VTDQAQRTPGAGGRHRHKHRGVNGPGGVTYSAGSTLTWLVGGMSSPAARKPWTASAGTGHLPNGPVVTGQADQKYASTEAALSSSLSRGVSEPQARIEPVPCFWSGLVPVGVVVSLRRALGGCRAVGPECRGGVSLARSGPPSGRACPRCEETTSPRPARTFPSPCLRSGAGVWGRRTGRRRLGVLAWCSTGLKLVIGRRG